MTTTNAPMKSALHSHIDGNWITGTVGPFLVHAKCFEESSHYGMLEDGRLSKLWIALPGTADKSRTVLYDYDRGDLVTNPLTDEGLAEGVAAVAKKI